MFDSKWILKSKTVWLAIAIAALTAFDSQIQTFISDNPGWFGSSVSFLFLFLRIITGTQLTVRRKSTK